LETEKAESLGRLGEKTALHIADFHGNNWIDVLRWINSEYSRETKTSLLFFYYHMLFKEILWMQLLFLSSNYGTVCRNLRYVWELICQGYLIDSKCLDENLDERILLAYELEEKKKFGWTLVKSALRSLGLQRRQIDEHIHSLWIYLCKHAHPSPQELGEVADEHVGILFIDSFNQKLATQLLGKIDAVFDIIYFMLFKEFPRAANQAKVYEFLDEWRNFLPISTRQISRAG